MKTSVIDVHDMRSVLSLPGVEKRIAEVPGVESVTFNHAAGSATARYDETRLQVADIKSDVRQRGYESAEHEDTPKPAKKTGGPSSAQNAPREAPVTAVPAGPVAADGTEKVDAKPTPPADTAPKEALPGAASGPPNGATPAATPAATDAATPEAVPADPPAGAQPDAQEPGLVEKATAWVRETLGGDDMDKP